MAISISQASDLRCPLVLLGNLVLGTAASEALGHIAFVTTVTDLLHKMNPYYQSEIVCTLLKSTQYKKLAPNALQFTYRNLKSCKKMKQRTSDS